VCLCVCVCSSVRALWCGQALLNWHMRDWGCVHSWNSRPSCFDDPCCRTSCKLCTCVHLTQCAILWGSKKHVLSRKSQTLFPVYPFYIMWSLQCHAASNRAMFEGTETLTLPLTQLCASLCIFVTHMRCTALFTVPCCTQQGPVWRLRNTHNTIDTAVCSSLYLRHTHALHCLIYSAMLHPTGPCLNAQKHWHCHWHNSVLCCLTPLLLWPLSLEAFEFEPYALCMPKTWTFWINSRAFCVSKTCTLRSILMPSAYIKHALWDRFLCLLRI
jgi:hypothetical protein